MWGLIGLYLLGVVGTILSCLWIAGMFKIGFWAYDRAHKEWLGWFFYLSICMVGIGTLPILWAIVIYLLSIN